MMAVGRSCCGTGKCVCVCVCQGEINQAVCRSRYKLTILSVMFTVCPLCVFVSQLVVAFIFDACLSVYLQHMCIYVVVFLFFPSQCVLVCVSVCVSVCTSIISLYIVRE